MKHMKLIKKKKIKKPTSTYNLHVKQNHNYVAEGAVVSNCHGLKANVVRDLINTHAAHISYRFGITGTFPKDKNDQYALKCSIGEIHIEVPAAMLIKLGYLSTLEIQPIEMLDKADEEFPDWASEKAFISKHDARLFTIAGLVQQYTQLNGNSLVLVSSIELGRRLNEMIPGSVFLYGESDKKLRASNYSTFADRDDIIVIATAGIAAQGISINRVFNLFMIDIGKSFTRSIQSIGRSLRKKGDKMHAFVFDIYSNLKFGRKHYKERKTYYTEAKYPLHPVKKTPYARSSTLLED
jgi:superfamily II DNA or RNA helicase